MTPEELRTLRLSFDGVPEDERNLRRSQFERFQRGEMSERVRVAFAKWLDANIRLGLIVVVEAGILRKGLNFTKAIVRHVRGGKRQVPDDVRKERRATCEACELFNAARVSCRHAACGCRLKVKITWATESCPVGRWGKWEGTNETETKRGEE